MAAWLGWQIESNWTDPFLFAIYSIIKPLAAAAILVVMYSVITQGDFQSPMFTYMYLGNALYYFVTQIMNSIVWAIVDDREHYKTLKYIYTAPIHFPTYLFGRSVASFFIASMAVLITLTIGVVFLHVQIDPLTVNWPLFLITMAIGVNTLALLGFFLAGFMLIMVQHSWELGGAVAGSLFLFSGAIFPLTTLPPFLRWIGYLIPISYWLELARRALAPPIAAAFPTFSHFNNPQLLGILLVMTFLLALVSSYSFRRCEHIARETGRIDTVTNY